MTFLTEDSIPEYVTRTYCTITHTLTHIVFYSSFLCMFYVKDYMQQTGHLKWPCLKISFSILLIL
jgi:hypothetical protein